MTLLGWPAWLSPWDYTTADWTGLTFFVLLGAGAVALRQAHEARRLREDQARPFVVIDFHPSSTFVELKIANTGRTLARDVAFTFDPTLSSTVDFVRAYLLCDFARHGLPRDAGEHLRLSRNTGARDRAGLFGHARRAGVL